MTGEAKQDVGGAELEVEMAIAMATSTAVGRIVDSKTTETGIETEVSIYLLVIAYFISMFQIVGRIVD